MTRANQQEALDVLREWRAHAILLDLMMPVMDGWAFRAAQRGAADLPSIPVIVLSAAHQARATAEELGASLVIAKPFELDDVIAAVGRMARPSPQ